jgi:hypothetical protein
LIQVFLGSDQTQAAFTRTRLAHNETAYFLWISDEGTLHAEAVHQQGEIPLSHLLVIQAPNAMEVWRTALEATQTGLFATIFLRASRPCSVAHLRKLQLVSQKMQCEVFIFSSYAVAHWTLKETFGKPFPCALST